MTTIDPYLKMAELFRTVSHGVYVIGVSDGHTHNAFTAAWVMQTSFKPLMLALSVNPEHSSYNLMQSNGMFSINVLSDNQLDLAEHFGQPASHNKLLSIPWRCHKTQAPVMDEAMAFFECQIVSETNSGDHNIVVGSVINGELRKPDAITLDYRQTGELDQSSSLYPKSF